MMRRTFRPPARRCPVPCLLHLAKAPTRIPSNRRSPSNPTAVMPHPTARRPMRVLEPCLRSSRITATSNPITSSRTSEPVIATKDHVAAGLLAIFLGALGIHKFYLGYNTAGFIMLAVTILGSLFTFGLAGGVMWVIGIIEGILYLTKSQSEFEQMYVVNKREWF